MKEQTIANTSTPMPMSEAESVLAATHKLAMVANDLQNRIAECKKAIAASESELVRVQAEYQNIGGKYRQAVQALQGGKK